jgi:hypothetical protein
MNLRFVILICAIVLALSSQTGRAQEAQNSGPPASSLPAMQAGEVDIVNGTNQAVKISVWVSDGQPTVYEIKPQDDLDLRAQQITDDINVSIATDDKIVKATLKTAKHYKIYWNVSGQQFEIGLLDANH